MAKKIRYGFSLQFTIAFLLPAILILLVFMLYPMAFTIYLSFHKWDGFSPMEYVGLENYQKLFQSKEFLTALKNNLLWVLIMVPMSVILGFLLAYFLREHIFGATAIKAIIFLGMVIPQTVAAIVFMFIYDPYAGIVNAVLMSLGIIDKPVPWFSDPNITIYVLIISSVWIWLGFTLTVYTAAIEGIPKELLEAAEIDGLSTTQKIRWVVWPMVKPATTVATIMSIVWALKIFDIIYVMSYEGVPPAGADVLAYRMYVEAFRAFRFGRASAIAVILTIFVLGATFILFKKILKRR